MPDSIVPWRKAKNLSQQDLGKAISQRLNRSIGDTYAQKKIARFEAGTSAPTPDELKAMAEVLDVDLEELRLAIAARTPIDGPSRMEELGVTGPSLMAICILSRPRPQTLTDSFQAVKETIAKGNFSMAVFLPYPGVVKLPAASDHINNLVGYYAHIRKSLLEANLLFMNALGPELAKSIALYVPREEIVTSLLIPPVFRQFALTVKPTEPNGAIAKTLEIWTPGVDGDVSRPMRATGVFSIEQQVDAWESFFGEVIPHWLATRSFISEDGYWTRIR
jgi:transcriptional regulator with XRE-family HTH domain